MDLTYVYRIFHSTTAQYTFFLAEHGTFSKVDQIFGTIHASANITKSKYPPEIYLITIQ
jgi:hypothetical protein